jgi:hypothetical protein
LAERVGFETYAAVEKRSASLSQSATRFHLGKIWATILRSSGGELRMASHASLAWRRASDGKRSFARTVPIRPFRHWLMADYVAYLQQGIPVSRAARAWRPRATDD